MNKKILSAVLATAMSATTLCSVLSVSAADKVVWDIDEVSCKPADTDVEVGVTLENGIASDAMLGRIVLPEETLAVFKCTSWGWESGCEIGDAYPSLTNCLGNAKAWDSDGVIDFGLSGDSPCEPVNGEKLVKLIGDVADEATVKSVAEQYGVKACADENGDTYYAFPIEWSEDGTVTQYSGSTAVEMALFSLFNTDNEDIHTTGLDLVEGSLNVYVEGLDVSSISVLKGDANNDGKIDISDAYAVLAYYAAHAAGNNSFTFQSDADLEEAILVAVDINGDGKIDITDASKILSYYAAHAAGNDVTWDEV